MGLTFSGASRDASEDLIGSLAVAPELATGDGALGFWKALDEVSPTTRHQRCTVHKTVNVLDKLPRSVQPAAKADLRGIWTAPDRATAEVVIASFAEKYGAKYEKAVTCLVKDRDALRTAAGAQGHRWCFDVTYNHVAISKVATCGRVRLSNQDDPPGGVVELGAVCICQ